MLCTCRDGLLQKLDRSPVVEYWDAFITTRLVGLRAAAYEVLKEWLLSLPGHKDDAPARKRRSLFYSIATAATVEGQVNCEDCVMAIIAEGLDFFNPLSLPNLMDLTGVGAPD